MRTISKKEELRHWRELQSHATIGLVPTMGYLHEGHISLVRRAREDCDQVVVSIFVNPLQFNDPEDYENYPVNVDADLKLCKEAGADVAFVPDRDEIYAADPLLQMQVPALTQNMCGEYRPGHFDGVLMIVGRLFNLVRPDRAYFGKKDYQQYLVISQLSRDLEFGIDVIGVETVREEDGRAMSSRNARLSEKGTRDAALIHRAMQIAAGAWREGSVETPDDIKEIVRDVISSGSANRVEYVEVLDPLTLESCDSVKDRDSFLIGVAVFTEGVRLIDNIVCSRADKSA